MQGSWRYDSRIEAFADTRLADLDDAGYKTESPYDEADFGREPREQRNALEAAHRDGDSGC